MHADHFHSRQSERLDLYKQYAGKLLEVRRNLWLSSVLLRGFFRLAMPTDAFVRPKCLLRHVKNWPEQVQARRTIEDVYI